MERKYTEKHEWLEIVDGTATVGITDHAQEMLGEIVFVDLPEVGADFAQGDEVMSLESSKAISDVYAPISGEIVETNDDVLANPGLINEDAEGGGWLFKIRISDEVQLDMLMSLSEYSASIAE